MQDAVSTVSNLLKSRIRMIGGLLTVVVLLAGLVGTATVVAAQPWGQSQQRTWSFGIISDTQWTVPDDGYNPNTVAANVIKQVDRQLVKAGVDLVVAVGDTCDVGSATNINTRALYAQDLYNAGIAFYPLRGNHEAAENPPDLTSGAEFRYAFPQIMNGVNNKTPAAITTAIIPAADLANNPPAPKTGHTFTVGTSFSEPVAVNQANNSVSYSFQYNNATFMLLDQFDVTGNYFNSTIPQQQQWIDGTLSSRPANTHAFVFIHKNLLGGNHKDNMFGGPVTSADPGDGAGVNVASLSPADRAALAAKQAAENAFIASMQANKVPFVISGHDHHHYESIVTSPNGQSKVHQLIVQSDSSKFYTPVNPVSVNDVPVQQDLNRIGYYIVTVSGPEVTIDYYGDITGGSDYGLNGGTFDFAKMSTMSYNLNGTQKAVAQGASYVMTDNTTLASTMGSGFKGTTMSILAGTNRSIITTNYGKKVVNDVTTGWSKAEPNLASDILSLGGMSRSLGSLKTDEYVLSMSLAASGPGQALAHNGNLAILTKDSNGRWVNAVSQNLGISQQFVLGAWNSSYKLGTYGVDPATNTAWAVLNYNGDFAVGQAPRAGR